MRLRLIALGLLVTIALSILTPPPNFVFASGVNLTATGKLCSSDGELCFDLVLHFNPVGGNVTGSYEGTVHWSDSAGSYTGYGEGTLEGYFVGGDGGEVSGTLSGVSSSGGSSIPVSGRWEGHFWANGTGSGSADALGNGAWQVRFDAANFQAAISTPSVATEISAPVETMAPTEAPTDEGLVEIQVLNESLVTRWPDLFGAIDGIVNQDSAIIGRTEEGAFFVVDNMGVQKALPPETNEVMQMSEEFGMLQNPNLLEMSPAVQAFMKDHGKDAVNQINGASGGYTYFSIPYWLRQRQYLKITTRCINGVCSKYTTMSIYKSSMIETVVASSEHASIRGTINGGGDFIYSPQDFTGRAKLAAPGEQRSSLENAAGQGFYLGAEVLDTPDSALVDMVQQDSPAALAGIERYDLITKVDGSSITDQNTLAVLLAGREGGDTLNLEINRAGEVWTQSVTLASNGSPMIVTPTAEILLADNTTYVLDIGLNGATAFMVLEGQARVTEPISGSQVDVPAGKMVVVITGYEIGAPVSITQNDVNSWWSEDFPQLPGGRQKDSPQPLRTLIRTGGICAGILVVIILIITITISKKRHNKNLPPPPVRT